MTAKLSNPDDYCLTGNRTWTDLVLSKKTDPEYKPRKEVNKRILIVGGGVTALTTAWLLLDHGYKVTVISDHFANGPIVQTGENKGKYIGSLTNKPAITGQVAGALWEYPPAVCGQHTDEISNEKARSWCQVSRHVFVDLVHRHPNPDEPYGVSVPISNFFFTTPLTSGDMTGQWKKREEIRKLLLPGWEARVDVLTKKHNISQNTDLSLAQDGSEKIQDAYCHEAPIIDTDTYLVWLRRLIEAKGARVEEVPALKGELIEQENALRLEYNAAAILNATGLGALTLGPDLLAQPIRGCLIRVVNTTKPDPANPGSNLFTKVTESLAVSNTDVDKSEDLVFIVPRTSYCPNGDRFDILLLGGSVEALPHITPTVVMKGITVKGIAADDITLTGKKQRACYCLCHLENPQLGELHGECGFEMNYPSAAEKLANPDAKLTVITPGGVIEKDGKLVTIGGARLCCQKFNPEELKFGLTDLQDTAENRAILNDSTQTSPLVKNMLARCKHFIPGLVHADLAPVPFVQHKRPFRDGQQVRVEADGRRIPSAGLAALVDELKPGEDQSLVDELKPFIDDWNARIVAAEKARDALINAGGNTQKHKDDIAAARTAVTELIAESNLAPQLGVPVDAARNRALVRCKEELDARKGKPIVRLPAVDPNVPTGEVSRIVHAYGHGGSGFTLSFGSAMVAFSLLEHVVDHVTTAKGDPHVMLAV